MPIVFMFLASALIIPIGISYAAYDDSPAFTTPPTTSTPTNQTSTNMTMTTAPTNQTNITSKPNAPLDPLKQFESGVSAKDVQCQSGFSLVQKVEDGSPACVHSSSVQILIQRGWAAIQ